MSIPILIRAVQYIAIVILFYELIFALTQRPSELQKNVCMMIVATIIMFVGYNIELEAENLEEALAGAAISYIGKPYIMFFSLLFICAFYEIKISKKIIMPIATYCSLFCLLVFWNNSHHLYYLSTEYLVSDAYSPLVITRGPLYNLYVITIIIFFLCCVGTVIYGTRKTKSIVKLKLSNLIILMLFFGVGGYFFYLFGDTNGYDSTMLGVFGSVVCLFLLFTRNRIFDTVMFAQERVLFESSIGLIVLDSFDEIIYSNNTANEILKFVDVERLISLRNEVNNLQINDKVYEINKKDITIDNVYSGKSIEIADITISYNYQTRLEHDVKERTVQIENIQRELIGSLASVVEARSLETGEHIKRTKEYVENTAKELKKNSKYTNILSDRFINLLTESTPLHDIGKISVRDKILLKPGSLNNEEYEDMKLHTIYGAKIIESTMKGLESEDYINLAIDVALYHHESWDGGGYPKGLKGEEIPLSARIVAIADTYDALIHERCYKEAYSKEKAIQIINEEKGKRFEPEIVDAFLSTIS